MSTANSTAEHLIVRFHSGTLAEAIKRCTVSPEQLLIRLQAGVYHNVRYRDFCRLVEAFGFRLERTRGSHQIYRHDRVPIRLNLQDRKGEAKPYQVRQLLALVEEYNVSFASRADRR